ncbi:MAG TPA: hypothetical protein DCS82_06780 [Rhodospirillaceae bacterium]|nr:hypothetical protein [Rhodospirillaceae bacterium]HAT35402.1 hypothetical protein [Rhodospirillaceae bacterium]
MTIFGVETFVGLSPLLVALLGFIYFAAAFIRGLLGFGSGAPSVLFGAFILPPHEAVILSIVVATLAQLILLKDGIRDGSYVTSTPIMIGFAIASILGVWIFANLRAEWLTLMLGLLLITATLGDLTDAMTRFASKLDLTKTRVPFGIGMLAGLAGSIGGAGIGYFLSVYVRWASSSPAEFRGNNILISTFTCIWRIGAFAAFGLLAWHYLTGLLILVPAIITGNWLGSKASGELTPERYFRIFQLVLLFGAIILTIKGVRGLI